jgi:ubiquinone/menaquinone biosynthesis C-methylase UbiE
MSQAKSEYQKDAEEYYGLLREVHSATFTSAARQQVETTEERYESDEHPSIRNLNTFIEMLHSLLGDGPEISGVDFGCGSHFFVDLVRREYGWNAKGYDPDAAAIAEAKEKYPQSREAYFVNNPLKENLPLPNASQDFVFCNAVLQHFSDEEAALALREMARVLKTGGVCLLIFKRNVDDWQALSSQRGLKVEVLDHARGKVLIEDKTMKKALAKLDEQTKAKLPEHYREAARLFHVFSVGEVLRLAAKHGLQVIDSISLSEAARANGILRYFSGKKMPTAAVFLSKGKRFDSHDLDILWEYRNQQEDVLYGRINIFLIVQSMLFVAYTTAAGLIAGVIAYMGAALTVVGLFNIRRQFFVLNFARKYLAGEERLKAYRDLQRERQKAEDSNWFHRHFAGQELLCWSLPILMLVVWLALAINSIAAIAGIQLDLAEFAKQKQTFFILAIIGAVLSSLFLIRGFLFLKQSLQSQNGEQSRGKQIEVKQKMLAWLPLLALLGWIASGAIVRFTPTAWIDKNIHTLNYVAFGLITLFLVLLPAFRQKASKPKQKSNKGIAAGLAKISTGNA